MSLNIIDMIRIKKSISDLNIVRFKIKATLKGIL